MSNEEIKSECDRLCAAIDESKNRLMEIRAACKHEQTFETEYMWRVGSVNQALVCLFCGECVKFLMSPFIITTNKRPPEGRSWGNGELVTDLPTHVKSVENISGRFRGESEEHSAGTVFKVKTHGKTMTLEGTLRWQRYSYSKFIPHEVVRSKQLTDNTNNP
jgi:hypothetical protein